MTPLDSMIAALSGTPPAGNMLNTTPQAAIQQAGTQSPLDPQALAQAQANQPGMPQGPSPAQQMLAAQMANSAAPPSPGGPMPSPNMANSYGQAPAPPPMPMPGQ